MHAFSMPMTQALSPRWVKHIFLLIVTVIAFVNLSLADQAMEVFPFGVEEGLPVRARFIVHLGKDSRLKLSDIRFVELEPESGKPILGATQPVVVASEPLFKDYLRASSTPAGTNPLRFVFVPMYDPRESSERNTLLKFAGDPEVCATLKQILSAGASIDVRSVETGKSFPMEAVNDFGRLLDNAGLISEREFRFPAQLQRLIDSLEADGVAAGSLRQKSIVVVLWPGTYFRSDVEVLDVTKKRTIIFVAGMLGLNRFGGPNPPDRPVGAMKTLRVQGGVNYQGLNYANAVPAYGKLLHDIVFGPEMMAELAGYQVVTTRSIYLGLDPRRRYEVRGAGGSVTIEQEISADLIRKVQQESFETVAQDIRQRMRAGDYEKGVDKYQEAQRPDLLDADHQKLLWEEFRSDLANLLNNWMTNSLDNVGKVLDYLDKSPAAPRKAFEPYRKEFERELMLYNGLRLVALNSAADFSKGVELLEGWKSTAGKSGVDLGKRIQVASEILKNSVRQPAGVDKIVSKQIADLATLPPKELEPLRPFIGQWLAGSDSVKLLTRRVAALPRLSDGVEALSVLASKGDQKAADTAVLLELTLGQSATALKKAQDALVSARKLEDCDVAFRRYVAMVRLHAVLSLFEVADRLQQAPAALDNAAVLQSLAASLNKYQLIDWKRKILPRTIIETREIRDCDPLFAEKAFQNGAKTLLVGAVNTNGATVGYVCLHRVADGKILRMEISIALRSGPEHQRLLERSKMSADPQLRQAICRSIEFLEWHDVMLMTLGMISSANSKAPTLDFLENVWKATAQVVPAPMFDYAILLKKSSGEFTATVIVPVELDAKIIKDDFLSRAQGDVFRDQNGISEMVVPVVDVLKSANNSAVRKIVALLRLGLKKPADPILSREAGR